LKSSETDRDTGNLRPDRAGCHPRPDCPAARRVGPAMVTPGHICRRVLSL